MNKLEGKYNKEERGEGFFSAMFSKQSSYDTFHCNEDNDYREEDYDYKEVDDYYDVDDYNDDDCPPQIDYIDPSAPSYNPSTMSGMFFGILILVLIPYIISLVLFLIFS